MGQGLINRGEKMESIPIDKLEKIAKNRYAAVLIAAKHARKLNSERLTEKEKLDSSEEEGEQEMEIDSSTKVVRKALKDLLEGKIKFEFPRK